VNDTAQLAAPRLPLSVHRPPLLSFAAALLEKLTVPVGVVGAPGPVSLTVAVHVVACPGVIAVGEQPTNVEVELAAVGRPMTATEVDAVSTAWVGSPLYAPLIRCMPEPTAVGVYETVQVPVDPVAVRLH
jgi:hypothetical protein